jgi:hypothetical protein
MLSPDEMQLVSWMSLRRPFAWISLFAPSTPGRMVGCDSHTWEAWRSPILLICCSIAAALARLAGKERQKLCLPLIYVPFLSLAHPIVSVL